ncbi:PREDICTED: 39S ribosomal protein L39, mitochondrial [Dinoponera quadriceps]|uniref:39S ribosomal protein L39, mitochondrial n=1 Tax=Dinoponera quadriceps TaxID=609295 RepID=A0A6P3YB38_DINQU|nr:PREDICTED: 39S ribosomal protein L39, mitochondrial [Dinoponera quadriceps]
MFHGCKKLCTSGLRLPSRCAGTLSKAEARKRRCQMFDEEKQKQRSQLGRIEKIEVKYQSVEDEVVLVMNRNISTPHDCARHISESIAKMSAIAFVDGQVWDMHRPFTGNCELQLVTMQSPRVNAINNAFWRTCSMILGAVADNAFKDNLDVHLHSFPYPVIRSGSFVYDVFVDLPSWQPTESELRALSALFVKFTNRELLLERLEVHYDIAQDMFQDNPFKYQQIPNIAKDNEDGKVTLYRLGDHIDISKGPMVGNSGLVGRVTITAVHRHVDGPVDGLYRFQGLALPKGIMLNHFAYSILENRAKKLNTVTWQPHIEHEMITNATASAN